MKPRAGAPEGRTRPPAAAPIELTGAGAPAVGRPFRAGRLKNYFDTQLSRPPLNSLPRHSLEQNRKQSHMLNHTN